MRLLLPSPVRSLVRGVLRRWHHFYDMSRGKWREFRISREAVRKAPVVVRDRHDLRFLVYPFDRAKLPHLVERIDDGAQFMAIPALVQQGNVAFDVGAHVGVYSVLLSRLCGPSGRVYSFEAVPDTYWRFRETLALNRCENIIPVQAAVCDRSGMVRMNLFDPEFSEWNTLGTPSMLTPQGGRVLPKESVDVPCETLDMFCDARGIGRINFLKVDVEGFELTVFRGAQQLLSTQRVDHLCFEISRDPLKGAGVNSRSVFEALEEHGYRVYQFDVASKSFRGPIHDTSDHWTNVYASLRDLSKIGGA